MICAHDLHAWKGLTRLPSHPYNDDAAAEMMVITRRMARQRCYDAVMLALLLALFVAVASCSPRLAKRGSTHPSFPLDAFAQPAYVLVFKDDDPVGNRTALELLRAASNEQSGAHTALEQYGTSQATSDGSDGQAQHQSGQHTRPFRAYLHRTSPTKLHICTLAKPRAPPQPLHRDEQGMLAYRAGVLNRALALLAPLKDMCLFHTSDWFTYSLCYGDAIKQFHALPSTLGGGKTPTMDASQDSYVLGRWRDSIERVRGVDHDDHTSSSTATVGDGHSSDVWHSEIGPDEQGSELMELVHFSSIEKPFLQGSGSLLSEGSTSDYSTVEGKGRYVSQIWADGTFCDLNNEPRTAEVQFHCAKSPKVDRISLIKEVTTCNYVVVVETPRLCAEPALAQMEDEVREVHCRPIVSDAELHQRYMQNVRDTQASLIADSEREPDAPLRASQTTKAQSNEQIHGYPASSANEEVPANFETEDTSFETQLAKLINKLSAAQHSDLAEDSALLDEVEIVVGMDEGGNYIIEPRIHSSDSNVRAGEEDSTDGSAAKMDTRTTQEKWADLLQKVQELQGGLVNADGQSIADGQNGGSEQQNAPDARRRDSAARAAHLQRYEAAVRDRQATDATANVDQGATGQNAQPQRAGTNGQQQQPAQRGNMMVRETESFAQRVDRLYKAQEEKKRKAKEQQDAAAAPVAARHDEL